MAVQIIELTSCKEGERSPCQLRERKWLVDVPD